MKIKVNDAFSKNMRKYALNVLNAGYGEMDSSWCGEIVNTPVSKLFYIIEGEFYVDMRTGERIYFKEGNVYLIPSGSSYTFGCDGDIKHLFFNLQLCSYDNIDVLGGIDGVRSAPIDHPMLAEELVDLAMSDSCSDTVKFELEIRRRLMDFMEEGGVELSFGDYSAEIRSAFEYINENLSIKLTLAEIAEKVHLAASTLSRKFRIETGMSVGEYINKRIMLMAERELMSTNASVLEISEKFGFCDQFYFWRQFKKAYGTAPSVYRKRNKV